MCIIVGSTVYIVDAQTSIMMEFTDRGLTSPICPPCRLLSAAKCHGLQINSAFFQCIVFLDAFHFFNQDSADFYLNHK